MGNADAVPTCAFRKCLIYMGKTRFWHCRAAGMRAARHGSHHYRQRRDVWIFITSSALSGKNWRGGRGQGRVLPCAVEQDKADIVEARPVLIKHTFWRPDSLRMTTGVSPSASRQDRSSRRPRDPHLFLHYRTQQWSRPACSFLPLGSRAFCFSSLLSRSALSKWCLL